MLDQTDHQTDHQSQHDRAWTRRLFALAVAAALAVSVIYLPQALLTDFAGTLGVPAATASLVATAVQVGYAVGIFFLVPLSDRIQPRRQVTVQIPALTLAMLVAAVSPGILGVVVAFLVVGLVANIAQLLIPAAGKLAPAGRRGATTSALVGALGIGIFGGRIVAGVLVGAIGWRWVVVVFAALVLATLRPVRRALRDDVVLTAEGVPYATLLVGTVRRLRTSPALVQSSVLQFLVFAVFTSMWTVTVLRLTEPPFGWTVLQAGLFGLVGLAAAALTPFGGRFLERYGAARGTAVVLVMMLAATTLGGSRSAWLFGLAMFGVTWANQTIQSANQNRVLTAHPGGAAQANTVFMVSVFLGGSCGAFLGPLAFSAGGSGLVSVEASALVILAGLAWALSLRHEHREARLLRPPDRAGGAGR